MPDHPPVSVTVNQPEPGFVVTLREVWDELRIVSAKLDTIHDLPGDVHNLQRDLRKVEDNYVSKASVRWWFTAIIGLIAAATALLALLLR